MPKHNIMHLRLSESDLNFLVDTVCPEVKDKPRLRKIIREDEDFRRVERRYGSFSRRIQLPCRVEVGDIEASYKKGILSIVMPKCRPGKSAPVKICLK